MSTPETAAWLPFCSPAILARAVVQPPREMPHRMGIVVTLGKLFILASSAALLFSTYHRGFKAQTRLQTQSQLIDDILRTQLLRRFAFGQAQMSLSARVELRAAVGQTEMLLLLSCATIALFAVSGIIMLIFIPSGLAAVCIGCLDRLGVQSSRACSV